jgi:hypothetical protein
LVMHDRFPAATQPVDQGGLTHVGAPKDGDDRKRQMIYFCIESNF